MTPQLRRRRAFLRAMFVLAARSSVNGVRADRRGRPAAADRVGRSEEACSLSSVHSAQSELAIGDCEFLIEFLLIAKGNENPALEGVANSDVPDPSLGSTNEGQNFRPGGSMWHIASVRCDAQSRTPLKA
jgi:hypothetical protein